MIAVLALIVFLLAGLLGLGVMLASTANRILRELQRLQATVHHEVAQTLQHSDAAAEIVVGQMHVVGRGIAGEIAAAADRTEAALRQRLERGHRPVQVLGWPPRGRSATLELSDDDATPPSGYAMEALEGSRPDP